MTRGVFARFVHDHHFQPADGATRMIDVLDFASPLGPLGRLADALFVTRHLRRLLTDRADHLRRIAEDPETRRRHLP